MQKRVTCKSTALTRWVWSCLCGLMAFACLLALVGATAADALAYANDSQEVFAAPPSPSPAASPAPSLAPMTVYVASASGLQELSMTGGTVRDALYFAGIAYDEDDVTAPAPYMLIENGLRIEYESVKTERVTKTEKIAYETTRKEDDTLEKGVEKTSRNGEYGEREKVYLVTYTDGEETSRELVSDAVTKAPVDEVIRVGTKVSDERVSVPAAVVLQNDGRKKEPAPKKSEIKETVYVEVTAYTHTGNKTATGTWPEVGTIAVNPKQIPYGTRLYVEGYGYGIAADTGGFRHTDRFQIDLFMDTVKECMTWGRRRSVRVYILE